MVPRCCVRWPETVVRLPQIRRDNLL